MKRNLTRLVQYALGRCQYPATLSLRYMLYKRSREAVCIVPIRDASVTRIQMLRVLVCWRRTLRAAGFGIVACTTLNPPYLDVYPSPAIAALDWWPRRQALARWTKGEIS